MNGEGPNTAPEAGGDWPAVQTGGCTSPGCTDRRCVCARRPR
jgi:hypothetical protein